MAREVIWRVTSPESLGEESMCGGKTKIRILKAILLHLAPKLDARSMEAERAGISTRDGAKTRKRELRGRFVYQRLDTGTFFVS